MVKNRRLLEKLEKELIEREPVDVVKNFRLVNAMYQEARALGIFPPKDPLEGIDVDIKVAKAINAVSKST